MSSVKNVLSQHSAESRVDDALDLIHEATENGIDKKKATPAILVHMIHLETDKTWAEICDDLDMPLSGLLDYRKDLVNEDIITTKVRRPSDIVSGKSKELLKNCENSNADTIFDGSKPSNWVAGAVYLDEWINLRGTEPGMVAEQYNCEPEKVEERAEDLVRFSPFARTYATRDIDAPLGPLLARRRHTTETLRLSLSDTSKAVEDRLKSLDRESDYQLHEEEFAGVTFYWASDEQE